MTRPFDTTDSTWRDWRWQMRERIDDVETLGRVVRLTADERRAIEATRGIFRWSVTPYYASLMDPDDPSCPIRRQVVPAMHEVAPDIVGVADPLEEVAHSPVRNLIHNYEDRVAFCVTTECAIYCRYCLRKRMVGDADQMMRREELRHGDRHRLGRGRARLHRRVQHPRHPRRTGKRSDRVLCAEQRERNRRK